MVRADELLAAPSRITQAAIEPLTTKSSTQAIDQKRTGFCEIQEAIWLVPVA
jgi:hypothetical protein